MELALVTADPWTAASSSQTLTLHLSSFMFPTDAVATPPVKSNHNSLACRTLLKKPRRMRRRSSSSGGSNDDGFLDGGGFGSDGGAFGGGGGRGWNFDGFGRFDWDDWSSYPDDPAFDFVYEVVCWIVFSNCLHFAFKKVVRIVDEGFGDPGREKVAMRLTSVC